MLLLVVLLTFLVSAVISQECHIGPELAGEHEWKDLDRTGLHLNLHHSAQCNGVAKAWKICYYMRENVSPVLAIRLLLYRQSLTTQPVTYTLVSSTNIVRNASETIASGLECEIVALNESGSFNVYIGDIIGACLPYNDDMDTLGIIEDLPIDGDIISDLHTTTSVMDSCETDHIDSLAQAELVVLRGTRLHLSLLTEEVDVTPSTTTGTSSSHSSVGTTHLSFGRTQYQGELSPPLTVSATVIEASRHRVPSTLLNEVIDTEVMATSSKLLTSTPLSTNGITSGSRELPLSILVVISLSVVMILVFTVVIFIIVLCETRRKRTLLDIRNNSTNTSNCVPTGSPEMSLVLTNSFATTECCSDDSMVELEEAVSTDKEPYVEPDEDEQEIYIQIESQKLIKIQKHTLEMELPIGKGHFGSVFKAIWYCPGSEYQVAVKSLLDGASKEERIKLLQEAAIMGQFHHPNVLSLYGVVVDPVKVMLVMEIAENGDLKCYLKTLQTMSAINVVELTKLLNFSISIAEGMRYLADKGFVHRDLAARNVLLTKEDICKICDFGLSRDLQESPYYLTTTSLVPIKWTAPEAILDRKHSTASDIWSYGCLLYEIWSFGKDPFAQVPVYEVLLKIEDGLRPVPPQGTPLSVVEVMDQTWVKDPRSRPSFKDIVLSLQQVNI